MEEPRVLGNNILWLYYEDMSKDCLKEIAKIVEFLNLGDLIDSQDLENIAKNSSFETMKTMAKEGKETFPVEFFRKGVCDDWKNCFNEEYAGLFDTITNTKFAGINIPYCTKVQGGNSSFTKQ
ncbi:sulfotransferase family cytosolic 1B member 1 [Reticulomyxa filosa]|uniref:Sulfotransferase family cytosolic 1B member 1 n=1 Tax=Reticulomyxa filosa TaxID=46433 RepID=X6P523_RETFI|nr:sulfotransferase family cytosolic 1B member 1 [Reticulomyxa filosa]|eukprot:ETO32687.1 sulfotransferase family cytosolic 1B member 1 [Reticulomyxa filosa]